MSEWSIIDQIAAARRHVEPPPGSFTIRDYIRQVRESGGEVSYVTALRVLREEVEAGRLGGGKFVTGNRERWHFWESCVRGSRE